MGAINGRVIYSPKGKALEYAENAANFYVGCSNGCTYCYLKKGRGAKVLGGNRPELKKSLREYPFALDIFKNELLKHKEELQKSGGKYSKRDAQIFYIDIAEYRDEHKNNPRIYWKDSFIKVSGIDRETLPGYCVPANYDLFNEKSNDNAI